MNFTASLGFRPGYCGERGELCIEASRGPWREIQAAAEAAYDRGPDCAFTAFKAYEWTGQKGRGANMHRNVVFANDVVPELLTIVQPGDLVITLGAGSIGELPRKLKDALERRGARA